MAKTNHIIAIDLGGSRARIVLTDNRIKNLGDKTILLTEGISHNELNRLIYSSIMEIAADKIPKEKIDGIALASAGIPDKKKLILTKAPNIPKSLKGEIRILPFLKQKLNLKKIEALNDCSAAAYASYFSGGRHKAAVYWTISSGTNIGIFIDGKIFNGQFQTTPEFGHCSIFDKDIFGNGLVCNCGGYGHLEAGVSGNGIANIMLNAAGSAIKNSALAGKIKKLKYESKNIHELKQKLPVLLFGSSDVNSNKIKKFVAENIAKAIGVLISAYGPGKIEIGGGLSKAHRQIISPAIRLIRENNGNKYYLQSSKNLPVIRIAKNFGRDYPWQGAALAWMNKNKS